MPRKPPDDDGADVKINFSPKLIIVGPAAIACLLTLPTLRDPLPLWDDARYWTYNFSLEQPLGVCLTQALTIVQFEAYHPLHLATLCFQRHLGADVAQLRLFGLGLLFGALCAMGAGLRAVGLRPQTVLGVTCIWVVHPLFVETRISVISQKDLWGLLFLGLTLYWSAQKNRWALPWVLVGVVAAGAAKSSYALTAGILATWAMLPQKNGFRRLLPAAVGAVWTLGALAVVVTHKLPASAPWFSPKLVLATLGHYLRSLFYPVDLLPFQCLGDWSFWIGLGGLAGIGYLVRSQPKGPGRWGIVIGLAAYLPFANLIPAPLLVGNRFGVLLPLAAALALYARWEQNPFWAQHSPKMTVALVLGLSALSWRQQSDWRTPATLWKKNTETALCSPLPALNWATAAFAGGQREAAESAMAVALIREPGRRESYQAASLLFLLSGDCQAPLSPVAAKVLADQLNQTPEPWKNAAALELAATGAVWAHWGVQQKAPGAETHRQTALETLKKCHPARYQRLEGLW